MTLETQHLHVDPAAPDPAVIARAAALIRAGALVAFPTETVYGLGANALDRDALQAIYTAKQRPANDPIIAHIGERAQLHMLARALPDSAQALVEAFWPGPLTLVLKRAPQVPDVIAQGLDTIAVRMPAHPVALALIRAAGVPIGAPSANTFTRPSATTAAHVLEDLNGRIDMVLDGGPTAIGLESTVLDLSRPVPVVLRPGGVSLDALRTLLPDLELAPGFLDTQTPSSAPGQLLKHYSPRAEVLLFTGADDQEVRARLEAEARALTAKDQRPGLLLSAQEAADYHGPAPVEVLGPQEDLQAMGKALFAALRALDAQGVDAILVRDYGRQGIGAALWDRLLRAAEGRVIRVGDADE